MAHPPLHLRPHHFLCVLGFRGEGYSDGFTANLAGIAAKLRAPGSTGRDITVIGQADAICGPCPLRRGKGCENQAKIDTLDAAHAAAHGLGPGARISWGGAQTRIRETVRPKDLSQICKGCRWLSLGYCQAALTDLHDGHLQGAPEA